MSDILTPGNPDFPRWAEGYIAIRPTGEVDWPWLTLGGLALGRGQVAKATADTSGENWSYPDHLTATAAFGCWPEIIAGWTRHMLPGGLMEYPDG